MRIAWLSANRFGYEVLKKATKTRLPHQKNINYFVFTLKPSSKTRMYDDVPIEDWRNLEGEWCIKEVFEIDRIEDESLSLHILDPHLLVVAGWRQIIPKEILDIPRIATIGFHPTPLPIGRGPAPIINMLLEGWVNSAVTLYKLDEGTDTGDVISKEWFDINPNDHASEVYDKIIQAGAKVYNENLPLILDETYKATPQGQMGPPYVFPKRTPADNEFHVDDDPEDVYRKIKAFSKPYLGAYIEIGGLKLRIWRATLEE